MVSGGGLGSGAVLCLDTSAMLKRVFDEERSEQLVQAIRGWGTEGAKLLTSALTATECERALRARSVRAGGQVMDTAILDELVATAISGVKVFDITRPIVYIAGKIGPPTLRTLDAIHLATAFHLQVDGLVTYDDRLAAACESVGIAVLRP